VEDLAAAEVVVEKNQVKRGPRGEKKPARTGKTDALRKLREDAAAARERGERPQRKRAAGPPQS
jgi:hypothetical protein